MGRGEEVRGVNLESDAEEGVELEAHLVAEVMEGADLIGLVGD